MGDNNKLEALQSIRHALTLLNESGWDDGERFGLSPSQAEVIHKLVLACIEAQTALDEL